MKIPEKISRFVENERVLLLVAGKQEALIYVVKDNEISKENHFKIPNPTYSDNEGHFKVRSQGKVIRSGSVRETDDREIILKFKKELIKNIKTLGQDFDRVLITASVKTKKDVMVSLSPKLRRKVYRLIVGNYCSDSPINILGKFFSQNKKIKRVPKNSEAGKIMRKSNQARRVIKGRPD